MEDHELEDDDWSLHTLQSDSLASHLNSQQVNLGPISEEDVSKSEPQPVFSPMSKSLNHVDSSNCPRNSPGNNSGFPDQEDILNTQKEAESDILNLTNLTGEDTSKSDKSQEESNH